MPTFPLPSPRATLLGALVAFALAATVVVADSGPNQAAHYALVRSLASGTAEIDPGETSDASYVDGRYYAAKAPGLALFTLPWYAGLRAVGLQDGHLATETGYRQGLWSLNLWGAVLPMLVLLLLMVFAAERVAPGYGLPAAVLLACGTLLLPFSTMFFDHVLSATLGFGAFLVLMRERDGPSRWQLVAAGGLLAGLAIVVEFPSAIVAVVLAVYAAARNQAPRRLGTYVTGVFLGIVPLLAYNAWAFGSPLRLSYTNALLAPAGDGRPPVVGANEDGFYGVGLPDPRAALSLLLSEKGMVLVAPLAIVALLGLPLLWRAGRRAETMVCGGIAASFLAYNAAYYLPWGGQAPGPRFLVPALPFLALPLALALRARPLTVAGIGTVSVAVTALATLTDPMTGEDQGLGAWWSLLRASEFVDTVATRLGLDSDWGAVVPFVAALAIACALALASLPLRGRWRAEGPLLAGAIGAWALVVAVSPNLLPANQNHGSLAGAVAVVVLVSLIAVALCLTARYGPVALLPAVPALFLAAPVFDERPRLALVAVAAGAVVAMAVWAVRREAWRPVAAAVDISTIGTTASAAGESLASVLPDSPLGEVVPGDPAT